MHLISSSETHYTAFFSDYRNTINEGDKESKVNADVQKTSGENHAGLSLSISLVPQNI